MSDQKKGAFTFVLHSHLPYCRRAGRWPHGEEWLHEGLAETYVPLLNALYDLREEGVPFRLTLGVTPVLAEQLADPTIVDHFLTYLEERIERAGADLRRYEAAGEAPRTNLAQFYLDYYRNIQRTFQDRFGADLMGAVRRLQDEGYIEVLASAATHGYLPLMERDSTVHAQLAVGADTYRRVFHQQPRAIWLPECAYRPAFYGTEGSRSFLKPGIEAFLAKLGIGLFFAETHTVEGGQPVGKAAGEAIGPYGAISRRYVVPTSEYHEPTLKTTYLPYWVQTAEVAALGRNNRTGMQVWSAEWGYPGDFRYREFHKKDGNSGLQYWKVSGAHLDLALKDFYQPGAARQAALQHAAHYAGLVTDLLADFHGRTGRYGIIAAAYDTELFGHWWFEGITWIQEVLRRLAKGGQVELVTASDYLAQHPPVDVMALPEGSWGQGGNHFTWDNGDTQWMWPLVHSVERRMEDLASRHTSASGPLAEVLAQAAREALLLESSDWPFLITTGQAREYAIARFMEHHARFQRLCDIAQKDAMGEADMALCREYFDLDNVFPDIDFRHFACREGG